MYWIGIGFLMALGAWLFTVFLRWCQRNPLTVVNAALIALTVVAIAAIALALAYDWLAGIVVIAAISSGFRAFLDQRSAGLTSSPAPLTPRPPSA